MAPAQPMAWRISWRLSLAARLFEIAWQPGGIAINGRGAYALAVAFNGSQRSSYNGNGVAVWHIKYNKVTMAGVAAGWRNGVARRNGVMA